MIAIAGDQSRTVLFSTHIISDLERVADVIWILRNGTIVWAGPLDTLKENVVRLSIHSRQPLPRILPLPTALTQQVTAERASAVVTQWNEPEAQRLRLALNADIEVEPLSLEDIFVEFHS
jgi:ABC-2 type transport system ATP-binding protein